MIYFDNNATTNMPAIVCRELVAHCNMGNPSASHVSAKKAKRVMDLFREEIAQECGFTVGDDTSKSEKSVAKAVAKTNRSTLTTDYYILFTSGASESNSTIITKVCDSYMAKGLIAHLIVSSIEHKSIIECVAYSVSLKRATVSYVEPTVSGHILARDIEPLITPQTALICVMAANNEIGSVNDIAAIGQLAHKNKVPFYTDAVQSFGKYAINPIKAAVDGFAVSFHKLNGPVGCGLLVLKKEWVEGYGIGPLIFGTQNYGMRGGTENIPAIAASKCAFSLTMKDRLSKNKRIFELKRHIANGICSKVPYSSTYVDYVKRSAVKGPKPELEIIFFDEYIIDNPSRSFQEYLPGTIFLAIVKRSKPAICNSKFKELLAKKNIIISVGSACNTASPTASHVLYALGADDLIRSGALRISLGDGNTKCECDKFVAEFLALLKKCVS